MERGRFAPGRQGIEIIVEIEGDEEPVLRHRALVVGHLVSALVRNTGDVRAGLAQRSEQSPLVAEHLRDAGSRETLEAGQVRRAVGERLGKDVLASEGQCRRWRRGRGRRRGAARGRSRARWLTARRAGPSLVRDGRGRRSSGWSRSIRLGPRSRRRRQRDNRAGTPCSLHGRAIRRGLHDFLPKCLNRGQADPEAGKVDQAIHRQSTSKLAFPRRLGVHHRSDRSCRISQDDRQSLPAD